jgi:hypothetical protein
MTPDFSSCIHKHDDFYYVYKVIDQRYYATVIKGDVVYGLSRHPKGLKYRRKCHAAQCAKIFFSDSK